MDNRAKMFRDRKLGRSWYGWDGDVASHETDLNEGPRLFYCLLAMAITVFTLFIACAAWLVARRPLAPLGLCILAPLFLSVLAGWGLFFASIIVASKEGGRFSFPYLSRWLTMMVPPLVVLSRPFGFSRDRISSSCIAVTNRLSHVRLRKTDNLRPLILLPRCLTRECVAQIRSLAAPYGCAVVLVGTNDQARARMREFQPSSVVAVACERDLVRGLYDYGRHIPILVIANRRPKGPCLEATIDMEQLRNALMALRVVSVPSVDKAETHDPVDEKVSVLQ